MSEQVEIIEDMVEEKNSLVALLRKLFLAGIGAVVMAQENVSEMVGEAEEGINRFVEDAQAFVDKLVERGELAEKDGRRLIEEMIDKRKRMTEEAAEKARTRSREASDTIGTRVESLVNRLNIPTRDDIDALRSKLTTLGNKVDRLQKVQEEAIESAAHNGSVVEKPVAEAEPA